MINRLSHRVLVIALSINPRLHYQPEGFSSTADNGVSVDTSGDNQKPCEIISKYHPREVYVQYQNQQRAINLKTQHMELYFITVSLLNKFYLPTKFHVNIFEGQEV